MTEKWLTERFASKVLAAIWALAEVEFFGDKKFV
jgi:hypothetical protein